jgi:hypothetical protein
MYRKTCTELNLCLVLPQTMEQHSATQKTTPSPKDHSCPEDNTQVPSPRLSPYEPPPRVCMYIYTCMTDHGHPPSTHPLHHLLSLPPLSSTSRIRRLRFAAPGVCRGIGQPRREPIPELGLHLQLLPHRLLGLGLHRRLHRRLRRWCQCGSPTWCCCSRWQRARQWVEAPRGRRRWPLRPCEGQGRGAGGRVIGERAQCPRQRCCRLHT